jgi:hypothetical protein
MNTPVFHNWKAVIVKRFLKSLSIDTIKSSDQPPKLQIMDTKRMYKTLRGHSNKRFSRFLQFMTETGNNTELLPIVQLLALTAFTEPSLHDSVKYWTHALRSACLYEGEAV